jgi:LuxR family transcriptional regulator, maltose regulon positive regulatory protein
MGLVRTLQGEIEQGLPLLARAIELRGVHAGVHRADAKLALAHGLHVAGDEPAAQAMIEEARLAILRCRDPGGLPRRFKALQALLGVHGRDASDTLPSAAELRVLRLLVSDLSLREIAGELYISPNTLKTHLRSLYRKLDARSREAAVARARERRLI